MVYQLIINPQSGCVGKHSRHHVKIFAEDSPYWDVVLNEFYVRDVNGKEIAIYQDTTLYQWNVWGLDNVGKIDNNGDRFFYLKDHLGSIRVTVDSRYNVVSAQDYDMWGHLLENRSYSSTSYKYKFTGKERDDESSYDYGACPAKSGSARYYVARIGRWGGVEPKSNIKLSFTPYNYCSDNPITRIDKDGEWDVVVHVFHDRSKYGYGIAVVRDKNNNEVFRFKIRVEGIRGRNRLNTDSDTPLGTYDIPDKNMWKNDGSRNSYGPNPRLIMTGESGEIKESGRTDIRIHGGRQEEYVNGNWVPVENPTLEKTKGCIRAYDDDVKKMKTITDELMKNDAEEYGEKVYVIDDLEEENGEYRLPKAGKAIVEYK